MLTLQNLTVSVGDKIILNGISYTFESGKTYAIMGPNGSGKSTLASAVMGHPVYELSKNARIIFNNDEVQSEEPHMRAKKGIFMSFQSPLSLGGVSIYQLMRVALDGAKDPLTIRQEVQKYAKTLKIKEELLSRSLNADFSGGEKKKMEVIQAALLDPKLMFFDEIDTGVDVDALKIIAEFMKTFQSPDKTLILITHYNRILKYLKPDVVLVLRDGEIAAEGDYSLAEKIEKEGYENIV